MKKEKDFDCVKMMRDIRNKLDEKYGSTEALMEAIKNNDYGDLAKVETFDASKLRIARMKALLKEKRASKKQQKEKA